MQVTKGQRVRYIGNCLGLYGYVGTVKSVSDLSCVVEFDSGDKEVCQVQNLVGEHEPFNYRKGSLVKVVKEVESYASENHLLGKQGVVVEEKSPQGNVGVAFTSKIKGGHNCEGKGPDGYCWRISKDCLEYVGRVVGVEHDEKEKNVKGEEKVMFDVKDVVKYVGDEYPTRKNSKCTVVGICNRGRGIYEVKFDDTFQVYVTSDNLKKLYTKEEVEAMAIARRRFTINDIVGIYPNEEKRVVVVKFNDNQDAIRVNCSADDNFDVTIAVALAIAYKNAGSKNQFKKKVAEKTKVIKSKSKPEKKEKKVVKLRKFGIPRGPRGAGTPIKAGEISKAFNDMFADSNRAYEKLFEENMIVDKLFFPEEEYAANHREGRKATKKEMVQALRQMGASYGLKIYKARKEKKLKQSDVAKLVGTVPSTISDWERDKYMPKPDKRKLLEKVLGI